jgi:hypothetical protein
MATIAEEGGYNYTVHNSLGMAISKGQLLGNTYESPEMEIDLNGFNNGVYFLTLTSKSTKETVKFLKN